MSKDSRDGLLPFRSPLSTEYSTPFSSVADFTMSRMDLDPSMRGERVLDTETPSAIDVETPSLVGAGLLGAVGPGDFGQTQGSLSSSPGDGSSHRGEQNALEAGGLEHSAELDRNMQDSVHVSNGFGTSIKTPWDSSLELRRAEGPWRTLPGRRQGGQCYSGHGWPRGWRHGALQIIGIIL